MALKGVSRVGVDTAGGLITGPGATKVFVEGSKASLNGDAVASHGSSPHSSATMVATTTKVFIEGTPVVRQGDLATCGHPATGSTKVFAG